MLRSRMNLVARASVPIGTEALAFCFDAFSSREPVPIPDQVRDRLSLENALRARGTSVPPTVALRARATPQSFFNPFDGGKEHHSSDATAAGNLEGHRSCRGGF